MAKRKLRYIDLFAGCGGLSLGLHNSGYWKGLFAVEKSPDAFATLKYNLIEKKKHFDWPKWLGEPTNHDIVQLLKEYEIQLKGLRGAIDLVAGGPPCQGFSMAGRRVESDQRNNLVHSYLKFIELVQPKMILFENVKGFKIGFKKKDDSRGRAYSEVVIEELQNLGYSDARAEILDFSEFGVPQRRQRCIIVATRENLAGKFFEQIRERSEIFLNKLGLKQKVDLKSAISDILGNGRAEESPDSKNFKAGRYSFGRPTPYQKLMRDGASGLPDSHRFANHSSRTCLLYTSPSPRD